jgi:hypothetical protein
MSSIGPTAVYQISSDFPRERKEYELTLKFKVNTFDDPLDCPAIEKMLNHVLNDWREGRHPFEAEMISDGLTRCLKRAMFMAIEEQTQQEFGNEMVPHSDGKGRTARWHLEAGERSKKMQSTYFSDSPKAELMRHDDD